MIKSYLYKTVSYLKRNGLRATMLAVTERVGRLKTEKYEYEAPSEEELQKQREKVFEHPVTFSVVVPVYHTPIPFYKEMIASVLQQTYPHFELILADAGKQAELKEVADSYRDDRIKYVELEQNIGIAENTNQALLYATGDYVALLDHDDVYTPNALYEMALRIEEAEKNGVKLGMLYSDEDKCDETGKIFYEPNRKPAFDLDLLMTNNYICHLLVIETKLFQKLKERAEFDGAQDHDLVLRVAGELLYGRDMSGAPGQRNAEQTDIFHTIQRNNMPIANVPKVLYHWRCHMASTAANPESKLYAYDAGTRAIKDFVKQMGWKGDATMMQHVGFSRVEYDGDLFSMRPEIAAVGGRILDRGGRIVGGRMTEKGEVLFKGLPEGYTGYLNRGILYARAEALDLRCLRLNPAYKDIYESIIGVPYEEGENGLCKMPSLDRKAVLEKSLALSKALEKKGMLLWDPQIVSRES